MRHTGGSPPAWTSWSDEKGGIELDTWKEGNKMKVSVKNLTEFKRLIEKAEKEAQQLHQTMNMLSCFTIDIQIETDEFKQE